MYAKGRLEFTAIVQVVSCYDSFKIPAEAATNPRMV